MPHSYSRENKEGLSFLGWLLLLTKVTAIAIGLLGKAFAGIFINRQGLTFRQYIGYTGLRDFQKDLGAVGIQNLLPPTSTTCAKYAKTHGLELSKVKLPEGTIAQWLGPRQGTKIIVLFHGGGYMSPAMDEHLSLAFGFTRVPRRDVSAVVLQYDLASENTNHYPRQLQQAIYLLKYLLFHEQVSPSEITLVGDSAGAHLLLSLLLHIGHPNPLVNPLEVKGHFSGAVLISPWINMKSSSESMSANKGKDTLTVDALEYWAQNYLGRAASDYWNSPLMAPPEWLKDVNVDEILVLYGENELMRDETSNFCERLKAHHPRSTTSGFPEEVHSHMLLNRFLRTNKFSGSESVYVDWMNNHLKP